MSVPILSFSTVADGDVYFSSRLFASAWTSGASDAKQQALNDGTRILNRFAWKGLPAVCDQVNCWPRKGVYIDYRFVSEHTVPNQILEAQYEIGLALLKGYDPEMDARNASVVSRGYSSVRVAYDPALASEYLRWGVPSSAAWNLMLPFLDIDLDLQVRIHRV